MPSLLVVHHTPTDTVRALGDAVVAGAHDDALDGVEVVVRPALEASAADVLAAALQQARDARLAILAVMEEAIAEPREEVGVTAPKMVSFEIPIDKIGEVIGPKGKVINAIQAETGADISVDDDGTVGTVSIGSSDRGAVAEAERQIKLILNPPQAAILGMHGIFDRPIAVNGKVVIRPMMYLALTYDHRLVDGADAARFLSLMKTRLEAGEFEADL